LDFAAGLQPVEHELLLAVQQLSVKKPTKSFIAWKSTL
jgi:hypothetical protein